MDKRIEEILGWTFVHTTDIADADTGAVLRQLGYWLPPGVSSGGDIYGITITCDHLIEWVNAQLAGRKVGFAYGGVPGRFYAGLLNALVPQITGKATLLEALEGLVRYVDKWKDML